jgi:hypothetical protein
MTTPITARARLVMPGNWPVWVFVHAEVDDLGNILAIQATYANGELVPLSRLNKEECIRKVREEMRRKAAAVAPMDLGLRNELVRDVPWGT